MLASVEFQGKGASLCMYTLHSIEISNEFKKSVCYIHTYSSPLCHLSEFHFGAGSEILENFTQAATCTCQPAQDNNTTKSQGPLVKLPF